MAWIESHQELGRHPKTRILARDLGISRVTAVGHLQFLWWWALDFAQDGDLSRYDDDLVAEAAEWDGDAATFVAAVRHAGFLDPDGGLHDWHDYAGKLIDQRHANADRQRRHRERVKGVASDAPAGAITGTSPLRHPATVQNPTVQNPTVPDHAPTGHAGAGAPEAAGAAGPPDPPSTRGAVAAGQDEGATADVDAVLDAWEVATGRALLPGARQREGPAAKRLLETAGSVAEAAAYLAHRVARGQSPELKFAARDYTPRWQQAANGARASPPGKGGLSIAELMRGEV